MFGRETEMPRGIHIYTLYAHRYYNMMFGFESWFYFQFQLPANSQHGRCHGSSMWVSTIHVRGRGSRLLPSLWSRPGCCGHLVCEPVDGTSLSLSPSAFQAIKINEFLN